MFIHNLKYTIKILFKNKVLIFWTFAFPIILGILFNMAFSDLESDEVLKIFDIAVVDNDEYKVQEIYKNTLEELSDDKNEDKLFNIKYVSEEKAIELLDNSEIKGYIIFLENGPKVVVKENGAYQTIIKYVINEINRNKTILEDLMNKEIERNIASGNYSFDNEEIVNNILNKINNEKVTLNNISNKNLSFTQIEYFTLIAMACMYGGILGITAINNCLANMSSKGKRISISPSKKSIIVFSSLIGAYIVSLIGIALLLVFLLVIIKVNFGSSVPLVILLTLIGDLAGISLGVLIASCFRVGEGAKVGISIAISMFFSVLSGMVGVQLKYVIDKNVPIVNLVNPNNLITDGFYSLYYYDTLDRYFRDIGFLGIFVVICLAISFCSLRRKKYDSI